MSAPLALAGVGLHLGLVFGVQEADQRRRRRSSWVDPGGKDRTERAADALFVAGFGLVLGSPALGVAGVLKPAARTATAGAAGAALLAAATVGARRAQRTMGAAWRTGVGGGAAGPLVEDGPFARVRNPVYTAFLAAATGAALLAPTPAALAGAVVLAAGLELQTRAVGEPHRLRAHGSRYVQYAARVGRFVPGVGCLRPGTGSAQRPA